MDVGQNGRPRGPQMEKSSLVLTIELLGYLILTHTHIESIENYRYYSPVFPWQTPYYKLVKTVALRTMLYPAI